MTCGSNNCPFFACKLYDVEHCQTSCFNCWQTGRAAMPDTSVLLGVSHDQTGEAWSVMVRVSV